MVAKREFVRIVVLILFGLLLSTAAYVTGTNAAPAPNVSAASSANRSCDPCPAITTDRVNLRKGPGTSYSVIVVVPANTEVLAYAGSTNGFRQVDYGQKSGWIHADYLSSPNEPQWIGLAATNTRLNFREGPSTGAKVKAVMPAYSIVKISNQVVDGYQYIAYNGTTGWAHVDYLVQGIDLVATRKLAIRAQPSATSTYLGAVPAWEHVIAFTNTQNGYVLVMYNSKVGWVLDRYLS